MSDRDRHVILDPETGVLHGLSIYSRDRETGRVTVQTLCDFGEQRLGLGAVVKTAASAGRFNCLECLATPIK